MNGKKQRVLLGMSGGVDSSVAGYLLREQGYDVVGVTMKVWPQDCISRAEDKCCGPQAIADARGVAHSLGIPHYVVDEADQFERVVIDYFSSEYQAGRTPNPCVMCNEKLKFGSLWEKARALDCDYIATGHYAIIEHHAGSRSPAQGRRPAQGPVVFSLQPAPGAAAACAHSARRDGQAGNPRDRSLVRPEGRRQSRQPGDLLRAGQRLQGVPSRRTSAKRSFIPAASTISPATSSPSMRASRCSPSASAKDCPAVRRDRVTSSTSTRRRDASLSATPRICSSRNLKSTGSTGAAARPTDEPMAVTVKIRYSHPGTTATLIPLEGDRALVRLDEPQKAVTPGQAAVCYEGDVVMAGGWICRHAAVGALA